MGQREGVHHGGILDFPAHGDHAYRRELLTSPPLRFYSYLRTILWLLKKPNYPALILFSNQISGAGSFIFLFTVFSLYQCLQLSVSHLDLHLAFLGSVKSPRNAGSKSGK